MTAEKEGILTLRKGKKLHGVVEARLKHLFKRVSSENYTLTEGYGTTSGRTDTTTFSGKGRIIHVEIIASEDMVLRDLNNLSQSSADLCIVVLMDEEFDPIVAEAYYRANAKDLYPKIWLSDIVDSSREEYVIGRLDSLIQDLERKAKDSVAELKVRFEEFIKKVDVSKNTSPSMIHLGIFPRHSLRLLGRINSEEELFNKFKALGILEASNPFHFVGGINWEFSHGGEFFVVREPADASAVFTQIAIGDLGEIVFTFMDDSERTDTLSASVLKRVFDPTFDFSKAVFEDRGYDGMVDILVLVTGVAGKKWLPKEYENNHVLQMLHKRFFYEDNISFPAMTFSVPEIGAENARQGFLDNVYLCLQRNTREAGVS